MVEVPDLDAPEGSVVEQVRDHPYLRLFLQAARAWGVRPSKFLEWDDEDRQYAMALLIVEADSCPGCGTPLSVTTAPEAEERFIPGPPLRCHRCTAVSQAATIHKTDYHPHAVIYTARERDTAPAAEGGQDDDTGADDGQQEEPPAEAGSQQQS